MAFESVVGWSIGWCSSVEDGSRAASAYLAPRSPAPGTSCPFAPRRSSVRRPLRCRGAAPGWRSAAGWPRARAMPRRARNGLAAPGRRPAPPTARAARASAAKSTCAVRSACAGPLERIDACGGPRTACSVSPRAARRRAVVDDERGAALRRDAAAERRRPARGPPGELRRSRRPARCGMSRRQRRVGDRRAGDEGEAVSCEADGALAPAVARSGLNWRTGRASKNSLAMRKSGPVGHGRERVVPGGLGAGEALGLALAQARGWSRRDAARSRRGSRARGAQRAQRIGHQRAAAGPELDEADGRGLARSRSRSWRPRGRSARRTSG